MEQRITTQHQSTTWILRAQQPKQKPRKIPVKLFLKSQPFILECWIM
uniref:Uncharacterized protein n=1 Tax=Vitis vinifera TaxID=29760 RepID=F6HPI1_VITVI